MRPIRSSMKVVALVALVVGLSFAPAWGGDLKIVPGDEYAPVIVPADFEAEHSRGRGHAGSPQASPYMTVHGAHWRPPVMWTGRGRRDAARRAATRPDAQTGALRGTSRRSSE